MVVGTGKCAGNTGKYFPEKKKKHKASKLLFLLPPDSAKGWLSHAASQHDQSPRKGQAFLQE